MIGQRLLQEFLDGIDTKEFSEGYLTKKRAYEYLDLAACIFVRETRALKSELEISTVEDQQEYPLPPSFIDLYMRDRNNNFFVRYVGPDATRWPVQAPEEYIWKKNYTTSVDYPAYFCIVETTTHARPEITGTATAAGAEAQGRCILEDTEKDFLGDNRVCPRDAIYNTTTGAAGIVLEVIDAAHLYCALFNGNEIGAWEDEDEYIIRPAAAPIFKLEAPALTSGNKITVPYISLPPPVFWEIGSWMLPERVCKAIVSGAASLFKTGKTEYKEAQSLGALFDAEVLRYKIEQGARVLKQGPSRRRERM